MRRYVLDVGSPLQLFSELGAEVLQYDDEPVQSRALQNAIASSFLLLTRHEHSIVSVGSPSATQVKNRTGRK